MATARGGDCGELVNWMLHLQVQPLLNTGRSLAGEDVSPGMASSSDLDFYVNILEF